MYVAMAFGKINTFEIWILYGRSVWEVVFPSHYAGLQSLASESPSIYSLPWARGWGRWMKGAKS